MSRLVVCVGNYAKNPYHIKHIRKDVYCMEELCYYLCEYRNLLDKDIMDKNLALWIGDACGREELSQRLLKLIHFQGSLAVFVSMILEDAYYVEDDKIRKIEKILRQNEELTPYERAKRRADNLIEEKKYYLGLDIYHQMIREIPKSDEVLLAKVYYNCGVVYAKLFYYEIAGQMFEKSLAILENEDVRTAYLYCKRCLLSKGEYLEFTAREKQNYEAGLLLERKIGQVHETLEQSTEKKQLEEILYKREKKELGEYEQAVEAKISEWETQYITMTRLY